MGHKESDLRFWNLYCGILYNTQSFQQGDAVTFTYDFADPNLEVLKSSYPITKIAGTGGDFKRALRLCKWIAGNIAHQGDFSLTKDIEINSLSLLDYSFGKNDKGVNCVCKSKILVECCLAVGIYARMVGLYPYSPYDLDNHVVVEIYDRKIKKWIMLDPTTGCYFTDGEKALSCIEMRENIALNAGGSVVLPRQNTDDLKNLFTKNLSLNNYFAKNIFLLTLDTVSGFGQTKSQSAYLLPNNFDYKSQRIKNAEFMLDTAAKEHWEAKAISSLKNLAESMKNLKLLIGSLAMWNSPV